jgi:valyl-tRNA synthetase
VRAAAPYAVKGEGELVHRWIFSRLASAAGEAGKALDEFRFHEACQTIYRFFRGDFCDWYIEWVKPQLLTADREVALAAWRNIFAVLDAALRLLHPVMPFLTEELWHKLPQPDGARSIALDRFPTRREGWFDASAQEDMALIQDIIAAARNIRAEMKADPRKNVAADFSTNDPALRKLVESNLKPLLRLANLSGLRISAGHLDATGAAVRSTAQFDLRITYDEAVDQEVEITRLKKEIERLAKDIESKKARLADETFLSKAPAKIVADLKSTLAAREIEQQKLLDRLSQLERA